MTGNDAPLPANPPNDLDLSPYAGHWVALVRGQVAGFGRTDEEARRAAHVSRPKEKPALRFVTVDDWQSQPLIRHLWRIVKRRGANVLLVGGAVRDGLLGRPLHDLDFVVDGDVNPLATAVSRALRGALVPLDPKRGIARVVVQYIGQRVYLDFARRQGEDWDADLGVRDFTVNAIAIDAAGHYLDPLGGQEDLAAGRLRATNEGAFRDDPLRTLRAVRLKAELDLTIEPETAGWIRRDAPLLPRAAPERIRDEFVRILVAPGAAQHLAVLDELALLVQVLPEVKTLQGVGQTHPHRWDVWTHTTMTVEAAEAVVRYLEGGKAHAGYLEVPGWVWGDLAKRLGSLQADLVKHLGRVISDTRDRRFAFKLAALLHDVGKPQTRSVGDDGRVHFFDHEQVGAELAAERLWALRFSNDEIALARNIIAHHLWPGHLAQAKGPTRRAIYRFFKGTGEVGVEVGLLSLADMLATWGSDLPSRHWLRRLDVVTTLLSAFFDQRESVAPTPLINGRELMGALGLSPGPEVGRLLEAIREAQATGEIRSREAALALASRLMREEENAKGITSSVKPEE
jgi:putative nucleotidyltransferase with HDIG domain